MSNPYRGKRAIERGGRRTVLVFCGLLLLVLAAAALGHYIQSRRAAQPSAPVGNFLPPQAGSGSASSQDTDPVQADPPPPKLPRYDFTQPAPERAAVDNSYFDDAAFVGDSRTDGFMLYSGVGTGKGFTSNGLSIFKLAEKKALTIDGKDYTLLEALELEQYGKVYLCLGVNELGIYKDDAFYESYCQAIELIRQAQPNAIIYIQGLIPVNEGEIVNYNGNKYKLSNEHLRVYNDLMRRAAEEKQVVYLDLYAAFADENGELPQGASRDGVHLGKESCIRWLEYLKTHTVEYDDLYPNGPPKAEPVQPAEPDNTTADGSVPG